MPRKPSRPAAQSDRSAAVLTVSDRSFRGQRPDTGGPRVARALCRAGFDVVATALVPDDRPRISSALRKLARKAALVVTTGGTGLSPRDVTPEATREVLDREIPGFGEAMRAAAFRRLPSAVLSRALGGTLKRSLVLNLPGNPAGAVESLGVLLPCIPHALAILRSPSCDPHR